jgi:hypothetical protein
VINEDQCSARRDPQRDRRIGSLLGGWLVAPLLGAATVKQNDFSIPGLLPRSSAP